MNNTLRIRLLVISVIRFAAQFTVTLARLTWYIASRILFAFVIGIGLYALLSPGDDT